MTSISLKSLTLNQQLFKKIYFNIKGKQKSSAEYKLLGHNIYQWLLYYDPNYTKNILLSKLMEDIEDILDTILGILEFMKAPSSLLSHIICNANKFLRRTGIMHSQLFNLLLTSTIVTIKFWSESIPMRNSMFADIFRFEVKDINVMERRFLIGIDYKLAITEKQIEIFFRLMSTSEKKQSK
ncbi:hypothetical protein PPL_04769 [Heterostelium album PN500]|uniref:Cyclin N-terminal domain-containing protein n=1 Tax=Heterostelium pallidum (strain ATCC 26659 / Pp 5 / PN500) TaxID=670386 RepID=D3B8H6_HETP5|nr:hypothetical protein PPL_04769 [Heterostelium album PN500]EFA82344.1 hypothetical protein PPL_04769 [Heterostelium album PN500]|eukprot:XP_020434461.1 hypothetical protein PPL_04769 [Heterostelium album PN500]